MLLNYYSRTLYSSILATRLDFGTSSDFGIGFEIQGFGLGIELPELELQPDVEPQCCGLFA